MQCGNCGAEASPGASFCPSCGSGLGAEPAFVGSAAERAGEAVQPVNWWAVAAVATVFVLLGWWLLTLEGAPTAAEATTTTVAATPSSAAPPTTTTTSAAGAADDAEVAVEVGELPAVPEWDGHRLVVVGPTGFRAFDLGAGRLAWSNGSALAWTDQTTQVVVGDGVAVFNGGTRSQVATDEGWVGSIDRPGAVVVSGDRDLWSLGYGSGGSTWTDLDDESLRPLDGGVPVAEEARWLPWGAGNGPPLVDPHLVWRPGGGVFRYGGPELRDVEAHLGDGVLLAFTADHVLLSPCDDTGECRVELVERSTGERSTLPDEVARSLRSADLLRLAPGADRVLRARFASTLDVDVVDLITGEATPVEVSVDPALMSFSHDGRFLAGAFRTTAFVRELDTGIEIVVTLPDTGPAAAAAVLAVE